MGQVPLFIWGKTIIIDEQ